LILMVDVAHQWGSDLAVSATGDIAMVTGSPLGQQRVLRRLLTNPGDYIWQLDYGAGLARFIGQPANSLQIKAVIRSQIFKETAVARQPEPLIDVQIAPGGAAGTVYVYIRYVDAESGQTQVLSFSVSG
jgi:phage baseplate assembly protein W